MSTFTEGWVFPCRALGYRYSNGEPEKQDKFLKRMTGFIRLYAAILITPPPRGCQPSPHNLSHGWTWLARVMNLEPRPDITATILLEFLQVTGHSFLKTYSKQFAKLVQVLISDYLPKIRKITPDGSGGPITRLEEFLQNIQKTNRVDPPPGFLAGRF